MSKLDETMGNSAGLRGARRIGDRRVASLLEFSWRPSDKTTEVTSVGLQGARTMGDKKVSSLLDFSWP